jgi:hypothetical protein
MRTNSDANARREMPMGNIATRNRIFIAFSLSAFIAADPTAAGATSTAPAALYGKSISLSWQTTRMRKDRMTGAIQEHAGSATLRIYISNKGRIFSEKIGIGLRGGMANRHGWSRTQMSQEVSDEGDNREVREWRTEGRSLVAYKTFMSGARRLVIDFDNDYKSCSLKVSFAKEGGTRNIIQGHGHWEILSIGVSSPSCRIQEGNVFE